MAENNNNKKQENQDNKEYSLEDLRKATIKDADEFQNEFEMVAEEVELKEDTSLKDIWMVRVKVLVFSGIFACIGNYINTYRAAGKAIKAGAATIPAIVTPLEAAFPLLMMLIVILLGCAMDDFLRRKFKFNLPSILYISLLAMVWSIPGFLPFSEQFATMGNKIGLLPLCTPILAYAGIALGNDLESFKKQGVAIVCVACCAFIGTYVVSLIVAEVLLRAFGQI